MPRDAFIGGHVNALKLHHKAAKDEVIMYNNIVSLYPQVLMARGFPMGEPTITVCPTDFDLDTVFGLVKCRVLAPQDLYLGVLPYKSGEHKRLLFPLCSPCADQERSVCEHSNDGGSWIGTFCSEELKLATQNGYKIVKVYKVWNFPK